MPKEPISRVLIVGAGWVGRQVAARMAQHGVSVWLCDRDASVTQDAISWIRQLDESPSGNRPSGNRPSGNRPSGNRPSGNRPSENRPSEDRPSNGVEKGWKDGVQAARQTNELTSADVATIELALECVPEQISLKKRVLRQVSLILPPTCILASNSSYFVPSMLAKFVASPSRFAHMHFHVPVLRESVCDIVGCDDTSPEVIERLACLAEQIKQPPIILRHEHPGYIFNWLLQSVLKGALELAAQDVVEPDKIDQSWKAVTGMPLGPFGMMDQIGLDVIEQVLSNSRWASPTEASVDQLLGVLRPLIDAGKLGVKTQAGFYDYET